MQQCKTIGCHQRYPEARDYCGRCEEELDALLAMRAERAGVRPITDHCCADSAPDPQTLTEYTECTQYTVPEERSALAHETPPAAADFLQAALGHMQDRAATYDNAQGERSMGKTITAFNALTGHSVSETEGWLLMALLKIARATQGAYKADSYQDGAAYFGLAGEAAARHL